MSWRPPDSAGDAWKNVRRQIRSRPARQREAAIAERPTEAPLALVEWSCIVWDDPVNLMSYVTHVFSDYFGYPKERAERLMLQVHNDGKSAVASAAARPWRPMSTPCTAMACGRRWSRLREGFRPGRRGAGR